MDIEIHPLAQFGWNDFFAAYFQSYAERELDVGRVIFEDNLGYRVHTAVGEFRATTAGRLRHEVESREELPAVGDWVALKLLPSAAQATIEAVLPRRSKFTRKVAGARTEAQIVGANIETVFLVTSLNLDFNPRRIERYLALVWESGSHPVIVLSKADLCAAIAAKVDDIKAVARDVPVHVVSVRTGEGLDAIRSYLRFGETVALLGSSGVGKSTLINYFIGYERQHVKALRDHDDRGQHATRHRELILLPEGGLVLDTPGMRELQLWEGREGVQAVFEDIEMLARECFFSDCRHQGEPRCAIRAALNEGCLDADRFENYNKLQRELAHFALRQDDLERRIHRQKWKKLSRLAKDRARIKRGGEKA